MALYNELRPQRMAEVQGQEPVTTVLKAQMKTKAFASAYLFTGTRGTGKTTTARIVAKAINCRNPDENGEPCNCCESCRQIIEGISGDVQELDAARYHSVEDARTLVEQTAYPPVMGKKRVFIIDEVHMFTSEAFNTLLKTIEEPPGWCTFILCTTEEYKVPATIVSRCQRFSFQMVDTETIQTLLYNALEKKGEKADLEAMMLIAKAAKGSVRDALSILDKCRDDGVEITADYVRRVQGIPDEGVIFSLLTVMGRRSMAETVAQLGSIFKAGITAANVIRIAQGILLDVLRVRSGLPVMNYEEYRRQADALAAVLSEPMSLSLMRLFVAAKETIRGDLDPDESLQGELIGWLAVERDEERLHALIEETRSLRADNERLHAEAEQLIERLKTAGAGDLPQPAVPVEKEPGKWASAPEENPFAKGEVEVVSSPEEKKESFVSFMQSPPDDGEEEDDFGDFGMMDF